jgi:hypothetical protein
LVWSAIDSHELKKLLTQKGTKKTKRKFRL